ncbi:MAG: Cof-type HAD-IIB family hydrolase [Firmicutes bacterium]|nr:Cof-type HAD-IIB family hydrolase [Bacillota bacterium]
MRTKTIFVDLDETLLNDRKFVSRKTLDAIKKAKAKGHIIIPCTGSPMDAQIRRIIAAEFDYIISSNGAFIYDIKNNKTLHSDLIPPDTAEKIFELATPYSDCFCIHYGTVSYNTPLFLDSNNITQIEPWFESLERAREFSEVLDEFNKNNNLRVANKSLALSDPSFPAPLNIGFDIVNSTVSKGNGIRKFCELLSLDKSDTIAIGDGLNDIGMFENVNIKVAMGNALPQLKNLADIIVSDNNNDGVAEFLETLLH